MMIVNMNWIFEIFWEVLQFFLIFNFFVFARFEKEFWFLIQFEFESGLDFEIQLKFDENANNAKGWYSFLSLVVDSV